MLRPNDLRDVVLPVISIDEYEPKSGTPDEIIVVAFFVDDDKPAEDLDDFLEKGPYEIIDVDVSPNPNEDGRYLVFLEFKRNPSFFIKLSEVIKDVENLTGELQWKVVSPNLDGEVPLTDDLVRQTISLGDKDDVVEGFLKESHLTEASTFTQYVKTFPFTENYLYVKDGLYETSMQIVDFGSFDKVDRRHKISETASSMLYQPLGVKKLRGMLGLGWGVTALTNESVLIHNEWDDNVLLVVLS